MKKSCVPIYCDHRIHNVLELDIKKVYFMKKKRTPPIPKHQEVKQNC